MALEHRNLKNNWSTTLQADAAAADTTLSLPQPMLDLLTSPNPSSTEWYMLTLDDGVQAPEIVRCTAKGTGTATVVRSQEGTTAPTTWAAGTKVEIRATAELLRVLEGAQYDTAAQTLVIGALGAGRSLNAGSNTVLIGPVAGYALTTGDNNVAVGRGALQAETTGSRNSAFGRDALAFMDAASNDNTGVGYAAGSGAGSIATKNTFIGAFADKGSGAPTNLDAALCLGYGATVYSNNVASIGSSSARLSEVYIGGGQRDTAAAQVTLSASAGSGTDKAGGALRLGGGKGTGAGAPGKVIIATATAGASGATEQTWTDRAEWDAAGLLWTYAGFKTGNPGLGAGTWKLGTVQAGAVTLDTANYVEVDIGGVVVKLLKAA